MLSVVENVLNDVRDNDNVASFTKACLGFWISMAINISIIQQLSIVLPYK
jgi:hypothetical protein